MPGMGTGLNENDPTIVSAFHAALLRQLLVVLLILLFVAIAWNVLPRSTATAVLGSQCGRRSRRQGQPLRPSGSRAAGSDGFHRGTGAPSPQGAVQAGDGGRGRRQCPGGQDASRPGPNGRATGERQPDDDS